MNINDSRLKRSTDNVQPLASSGKPKTTQTKYSQPEVYPDTRILQTPDDFIASKTDPFGRAGKFLTTITGIGNTIASVAITAVKIPIAFIATPIKSLAECCTGKHKFTLLNRFTFAAVKEDIVITLMNLVTAVESAIGVFFGAQPGTKPTLQRLSNGFEVTYGLKRAVHEGGGGFNEYPFMEGISHMIDQVITRFKVATGIIKGVDIHRQSNDDNATLNYTLNKTKADNINALIYQSENKNKSENWNTRLDLLKLTEIHSVTLHADRSHHTYSQVFLKPEAMETIDKLDRDVIKTVMPQINKFNEMLEMTYIKSVISKIKYTNEQRNTDITKVLNTLTQDKNFVPLLKATKEIFAQRPELKSELTMRQLNAIDMVLDHAQAKKETARVERRNARMEQKGIDISQGTTRIGAQNLENTSLSGEEPVQAGKEI